MKFIIVDIKTKEFFLDFHGEVMIFKTEDEANMACCVYEFKNSWVCELKYNHIENY